MDNQAVGHTHTYAVKRHERIAIYCSLILSQKGRGGSKRCE